MVKLRTVKRIGKSLNFRFTTPRTPYDNLCASARAFQDTRPQSPSIAIRFKTLELFARLGPLVDRLYWPRLAVTGSCPRSGSVGDCSRDFGFGTGIGREAAGVAWRDIFALEPPQVIAA